MPDFNAEALTDVVKQKRAEVVKRVVERNMKGERLDLPNNISDIANLTEKQYNSFGWVRANDVLSADAYKNFTTEFAKALNSKEYASYKSSDGEYMIAVGERYGELEGVKNYIVYAKGTIEMPEITRILYIDSNNKTELSKVRKELYASERQTIRATSGGLFTLYTPANYGYKSYQQRISNQKARDNNQLGTQRRRGSYPTKKITGTRDIEGELVQTTYLDGSTALHLYGNVNLAYKVAVKRKDKTKVQKMLDEAADKLMPDSLLREGKAINKGEEAEGTLIKMYHGSGAKDFYTFEIHDGALGKGVIPSRHTVKTWNSALSD